MENIENTYKNILFEDINTDEMDRSEIEEIKCENIKLKGEITRLKNRIASLEHQLRVGKQKQFGSPSEKSDAAQLRIDDFVEFDEVPAGYAESEETEEEFPEEPVKRLPKRKKAI